MIFCVEDDNAARDLMIYTLAASSFEAEGFSDGKSLFEALEKCRPNLILLDVMLPGEDGLSILKKLRSKPSWAGIPVIIASAKGTEYDKVIGLDLGADDYLAKPFGMTELTSRVRAVLRRYEKTNKSKEYRIGELYVNPEKHIIEVAGKEVTLSFKEYSLLMVLLEADGNVVSRDALLTRVWGEFYDESRTLDVHIRKLRMKLESAGELIHTVKNIGYKLGGNENG